jgi:hypothetical protein
MDIIKTVEAPELSGKKGYPRHYAALGLSVPMKQVADVRGAGQVASEPVTDTTLPFLTPRQLWLAAARIGVTKDQVLTMIDAMDDQEAALDLKIEINEALVYERDHPAMDDLRDLMGIPPEQFDDLWIWASGL